MSGVRVGRANERNASKCADSVEEAPAETPASTKARNTWWVGDDSGNRINADAPHPTPANVVPVRKPGASVGSWSRSAWQP